jgi:ABC-type uncharacterized transport system ATPase component
MQEGRIIRDMNKEEKSRLALPEIFEWFA